MKIVIESVEHVAARWFRCHWRGETNVMVGEPSGPFITAALNHIYLNGGNRFNVTLRDGASALTVETVIRVEAERKGHQAVKGERVDQARAVSFIGLPDEWLEFVTTHTLFTISGVLEVPGEHVSFIFSCLGREIEIEAAE
jgi:hypothetical protein